MEKLGGMWCIQQDVRGVMEKLGGMWCIQQDVPGVMETLGGMWCIQQDVRGVSQAERIRVNVLKMRYMKSKRGVTHMDRMKNVVVCRMTGMKKKYFGQQSTCDRQFYRWLRMNKQPMADEVKEALNQLNDRNMTAEAALPCANA